MGIAKNTGPKVRNWIWRTKSRDLKIQNVKASVGRSLCSVRVTSVLSVSGPALSFKYTHYRDSE